ncbi:hypothetical protein KP509_37G049600 [Ceratopteris richardii]|uniref:Uncharacterized protein n=1 Tax=Ceratopteris richardii TaxID=49495 RepID=A0A8T2Q8Q1_CERRI|nr:hypothetical protein KP509_37G049600 [Ceratopteris richardii]
MAMRLPCSSNMSLQIRDRATTSKGGCSTISNLQNVNKKEVCRLAIVLQLQGSSNMSFQIRDCLQISERTTASRVTVMQGRSRRLCDVSGM